MEELMDQAQEDGSVRNSSRQDTPEGVKVEEWQIQGREGRWPYICEAGIQ